MSSLSFTRVTRGLTVAATLVLLSSTAFAAVESSCPAPCKNPPKWALFVRETGTLDAGGYADPLFGHLSKGIAKTVLRIDISAVVDQMTPMSRLVIQPEVNGLYYTGPPLGLVDNSCDITKSTYCSVTGTFWWDIDALEAAHPGEFVGKPLEILVWAGAFLGGNVGAGSKYVVSVSAQVVKKK